MSFRMAQNQTNFQTKMFLIEPKTNDAESLVLGSIRNILV